MGLSNMELYKSTVNQALDKMGGAGSCITSSSMSLMKAITNSLSPITPIEFGEEQIESKSWQEAELTMEEITLPGKSNLDTIIGFKTLQDNSFIALMSSSPALHYSENLKLIRSFPFSYANPTLTNSNYLAPTTIFTRNYENIDSSSGTIIGIVMPASHVVNIYNYSNSTFTFLASLGTAGSSGSTTSLLHTPISGDCVNVVNSNGEPTTVFSFYISCEGSSLSFVKKFSVDLSGSPTDEGIVFEETLSNEGKMRNGGIKDVERMSITPNGNSIWMSSPSTNQLGKFSLITNKVELVQENNLNSNGTTNDPILMPTAMHLISENLVVGDDKGHLSVFSENLASMDASVGKLHGPVSSTYPLEFSHIDDISSSGSFIFFVSGNVLRKTNLFNLVTLGASKQVIYLLDSIPLDSKIRKIISSAPSGSVAEINIGNSGTLWQKPDGQVLPANTVVRIKIVSPFRFSIEKNPIPEGVLIVEI